MVNVRGVRFEGGEYVQAIQPAGATINLNVTATSNSTGSAVVAGVYLVSNSVWTRVEFSDVAATADQTHTLLAPGERLLVVPAKYVNVVRATGSVDGVFSMTLCE